MIRPAIEQDRAFITSSWLQSFSSSDMALLATPKDPDHVHTCTGCGAHRLRVSGSSKHTTKVHAGVSYWNGQRKLIERLLSTCNVSVLENDDGLIDGWVVRELDSPVVHYAYSRASSRGRGVLRALLEDLWTSELTYTHKSRSLDSQRLPSAWRFDAYWLVTR